jgi:hypothetical protein
MTKVAKTVFVFSLYLFIMGFAMIVFPNFLLTTLGFETTTEIWIRLLGTLAVAVGIYYFYSAKKEQTEFFKATIVGRTFFFITTLILVILLKQPLLLAAIGSIDLIGAIWTYTAFKKNK